MKAKDLRNSILQLAVQGKLVPQDPNDEPASVLLDRIRAERARLIKEKKIRAPKGGESVIYRASDGSHYEKHGKGEPVCIDDEIPFEIPESWEWVRLGTLCSKVGSGSTPPGGRNIYKSTGAMLIRSQNVYDDGLRLDDVARFDYTLYEKRGSHVLPNDILLNITGASIGRCAIVPPVFEDADVNQHVLILRQIDTAPLAYVHLVITSPVVQMAIMNVQVGATKEGLSAAKASELLIPVAPLKEQQRIVEKVKSLLKHVDGYGILESVRERLDAELPGRLRKSVLQLAVQGRLVEQDPSDEPASVLLDRILSERAALVKAKKLKAPKGGDSVIYRASDGGYYEKRGKGEPVCIDDEIPFEIPESWAWCRLGCALREIVVPQRDKPTSFDGDIAWCRIEDVEGRYLNRAQDGRYVSQETVNNMNLRVCPPGTVFSACSGASIGRIAISTIECCTNQTFAGLVCSSGLFNEYLYVFLETIIPQLKQMGSGTTLAYISQAKYANLLLPFPPLEEQKRIVASVEAMREQLG